MQALRWTWHWCARLWGLFKAASSPKEDRERFGGEEMIPHSERYHGIWHYHGKYLIIFDDIMAVCAILAILIQEDLTRLFHASECDIRC